jgi:hypothetical protein
MPVYRFELRDGTSGIRDDLGASLPDREHALAYARAITHELMRGHELQTRWWLLNVYDEARQKIFDVPFASLDPAFDLLKPELRAQVIAFCERVRTLREMIASAKITMRESQALVAQSQGRPYLATDRGERTIRPLRRTQRPSIPILLGLSLHRGRVNSNLT